MPTAIRCRSTILYCADARRLSDFIPPDSIDLVVTSPPSGVRLRHTADGDCRPDEEHLDLLRDVFAACRRVMVNGARIAVVTPAGLGSNPWRPLASRVAALLVAAGFTLRGQIVWDKGTSVNRVTWGSFRLPTNPCLCDTTEVIVVAHKGSPSLPTPGQALVEENGRRVSPWLDPATFLDLARDRWLVPAEPAARVGHPAAFPVALVERLIKLYAFRGSRVLDPFAGSGTVGVASQRLGCRATLVEVDPACCKLAEARLRRAARGAGARERQMAGTASRADK